MVLNKVDKEIERCYSHENSKTITQQKEQVLSLVLLICGSDCIFPSALCHRKSTWHSLKKQFSFDNVGIQEAPFLPI